MFYETFVFNVCWDAICLMKMIWYIVLSGEMFWFKGIN